MRPRLRTAVRTACRRAISQARPRPDGPADGGLACLAGDRRRFGARDRRRGEIQLELLRHGAAYTTSLELSPAYDDAAAALIADAGVTDRVDRRLGDLAADGSVAGVADVVILHRVVCCYPDAERLLTAAAEHARRAVIFSHPPRNVASRSLLAVENLGLRIMGGEYRTFAHPPALMLGVLREHGFAAGHLHRGPIWQVVAASRETADAGP